MKLIRIASVKQGISTGVTLIEMVIAMAIISVMFVGFTEVFTNLTKANQFSKARTLATNLAQEQMQLIKQLSYYKIMVTTKTSYNSDFSPSIAYDGGDYYPLANILEGGITFTRLTFVQMASEVAGTLTLMGITPDTGMKAILVTVIWQQDKEKKMLQVRSVASNPDLVRANATITGTVTNLSTGLAINGALVTIAEDAGWRSSADASGVYTISMQSGGYTMTVSANSYFTQSRAITLADGANATENFSLTPMGSGTVSASVWIQDHPVISKIVVSSGTLYGSELEFVELYNPTTFTWTMGSSNFQVRYRETETGPPISNMTLTFASTTWPSNTYYLIASTSPIYFMGKWKVANAYYDLASMDADFIKDDGNGGIGIRDPNSSKYYDRVAWYDGADNNPPKDLGEGAAIWTAVGAADNSQFIRTTDPGAYNSSRGHCYDNDSNSKELYYYTPPWLEAYNSDTNYLCTSGRPATGAVVTCGDGLSVSTTAVRKDALGWWEMAEFKLKDVATGTWTLNIASGDYSLQVTSVVVVANANTSIPNSVTVSTWLVTNATAAVLSTANNYGFVSGWVKNAAASVISPAIAVTAGAQSANANTATGVYLLKLSTGTYDVTANASNANPSYVSQTSQTVSANLGKITSNVNFTLSQGGKIRGWVTRNGTNPIPGVAVYAYDADEVEKAAGVSGSDGYYTLSNLATGAYTIKPVLGSGESASPSSISTAVVIGDNFQTSTITISGAMGKITGSVKDSGKIIKTGVLVLVTTATLTMPPPALSSDTLTSAAYYLANSYEDGTYSVDVRGSTSTTYRVYASYVTHDGATFTIRDKDTSGVTVTAGVTTSGVNFSWP